MEPKGLENKLHLTTINLMKSKDFVKGTGRDVSKRNSGNPPGSIHIPGLLSSFTGGSRLRSTRC